ncbi:MAG: flagellar hook-basal body complex protein FliE [Kiloniellales bacterium]
MSVNLSDAISAYNRSLAKATGEGLEPRNQGSESGFAKLLRDSAESAIDNLRQAEDLTIKSAAGKADVNEVVNAVNQADIALQTVVAVRDRVIQAYQDILRMPI